jgi:O-antigen/teichoic acid export membrane protein
MTAVAFSKIAGMHGIDAQLRFIRKALWAVAVATTGVAVAIAAATPFAIPWVFGPDFSEATPLAWVLLLAVVVRSMTWMLQIGMQGIGRPVVGMISQWTGLAVLVPTAAALMPHFGAIGAAWSLVAAGAASFATAALLARRAVQDTRETSPGDRQSS